ncbi:MAG: hypothetical protein AB7V50_04890 [Vampirovibrionia bacterium]
MKITFEFIIKIYLVVLMVISIMVIADRLTEQTSRPIVIDGDINSTVLLIKKGQFLPARYVRL